MEDATNESLEHREHAEHAAHTGNPLIIKVSVTIAVLAVVAATVGSLETIESGAAISKKSESVLVQNRATDQWSYFQAQSIKKNLYDIAKQSDPSRAEAYEAKARDYQTQSDETKAKATELGRQSDELVAEGDHREHRHHVLTVGVTLLHVSIAIATIAIIMQGRTWPWHGSMILGAVGAATAAYAYLV